MRAKNDFFIMLLSVITVALFLLLRLHAVFDERTRVKKTNPNNMIKVNHQTKKMKFNMPKTKTTEVNKNIIMPQAITTQTTILLLGNF